MIRSLPWLLLGAAVACKGAGPQPPPKVSSPEPPATVPNPAPATAPPTKPPTAAGVAKPTPAPAAVESLPSGLTVTWSQPPLGNLVLLQLGLPAGSLHGAPGLAELALEVLVASSDATAARPSLRQAIAELGGNLFADLGPTSSWLTLEVPYGRWRVALEALGRALAAPTLSRHQLERLREAYLAQRTGAIWRDRSQEAARTLLLGATDTHDYLAGLLDRDVGELPLFAARHHRPRGAVLSLRVPGPPGEAIAEVARTWAEWLATPPPAAGAANAGALPVRPFPSGLAWSPAAGSLTTELTVVLPLPEGDRDDAAWRRTMVACLVRDGHAGRLITVQQEQGLGAVSWRSQVLGTGDRTALVLTATAPPAVVHRLWQCVATARQALVTNPPSPEEFATAARSAALVQRLAAADRRTALRAETWQRMAAGSGTQPGTQPAPESPPTAAERLQLAQWLAAQPVAGIAIGGTPPTGAPDVRTFELLPPGALARMVGGGTEPAQAAAAVPWLDDAIAAVGGRALLRELRGHRSTATRRAERAPEAQEVVDWLGPGKLRRERTVLGKTVITVLDDKVAIESLDQQVESLTAANAASLQREQDRHPLQLLAAHARGELQFRPVAQRRSGDREWMVLEALGSRFDRLRIHLDVASHLIRLVEVWEARDAGLATHVQEIWTDYRTSGGLRAPHHCTAELDDGAHRVELIFREWLPQFARGQ